MTSGDEGRARLALLGDVHGNVPALRAVLADVARRGLTAGVVTGDIAMRGTDPAGAVALVRALGWPVVRGNTDRKVGAGRPRPTGHAHGERPGSRSWTVRRLSDDDRHWLGGLPTRIELDLAGRRVVVAHGHPGDLAAVVDLGSAVDDLARVAQALAADVVVVGHTHRPMVRRVGRVLFVNPGAVGEGEPDDERPAWGWLQVTPDGVEAHLCRVEAPLAPPRAGYRPGGATRAG